MKDKYWKLGAIVMGVGLAFFLLRGIFRELQLDGDRGITVATTTGHAESGWVNFEFKVNGVIYKRADKGLNLKSKDAKYFVEYYAPDPSVLARVVSNQVVPECIGDPPPEGWKEIPKCK